MSCYLCQRSEIENKISCSECNQIFNLLCICNHLKKDNKCPKCNNNFIPNENIFSLKDFKKFGIEQIELILDASDVILKNMDKKIIKKNKIIDKLKYNKIKYKNLISVLIILINLLIYLCLYKLIV